MFDSLSWKSCGTVAGRILQQISSAIEILTKEQIEFAATGNIFKEKNFCIARLDMLSRNDHVKEKLAASDWDLIVCDEAHKMSATV